MDQTNLDILIANGYCCSGKLGAKIANLYMIGSKYAESELTKLKILNDSIKALECYKPCYTENTTDSIFSGVFYPFIVQNVPPTYTVKLFLNGVVYTSHLTNYPDAIAAGDGTNADINTCIVDLIAGSGLTYSIVGDWASDIPPNFIIHTPCNITSLTLVIYTETGAEWVIGRTTFNLALPRTQEGVCTEICNNCLTEQEETNIENNVLTVCDLCRCQFE